MADIETYKIGTRLTSLSLLFLLYNDLTKLDYIHNIEFEKDIVFGYINCYVWAEGIQGYVLANKVAKLYKSYGIDNPRITSLNTCNME
jgi:hypothetical protein